MKSLLRNAAPWALLLVVAGLSWFGMSSKGIQVHYINSGSMEPVIPVHSVVVTYESTNLKRNDMITFHNHDKGILTTHTFGGYSKDGTLKTKGEANEDPDNFTVPPRLEDVEGKVWFWIPPLHGLLVVLLLVVAGLLWPSKREVEVATKSVPQEENSAPTPA